MAVTPSGRKAELWLLLQKGKSIRRGEEIQRRWGITDIAPRRGKQELGDNYAVKVLRRLKKKKSGRNKEAEDKKGGNLRLVRSGLKLPESAGMQ